MKILLLLVLFFNFNLNFIFCQSYPLFSHETGVTINDFSLDAMEPALSTDGNALFFNSLNDGITTSLYYASKVNDSVFNYFKK